MLVKSPFTVIDNFISPLLCEEIIDEVGFPTPILDMEGLPIYSHCHDEKYEQIVFNFIQKAIPNFETYYNFSHKGTTRLIFEWIPENAFVPIHAENSEYINNAWVKTSAKDFTGIIFLTDYNNSKQFDSEFECYGGNLEFLNHHFSIHPSRGTLVLFPSDPRFSNATSRVNIGDAYQIRFHIVANTPFVYQPNQYPGNYTTWFK